MDIQTVIVILIVVGAAIYLARKYYRAAKNAGGGGCGCGCGADCPNEKKAACGDRK